MLSDDSVMDSPHEQTGNSGSHAQKNGEDIVENRSWNRSMSRGDSNRSLRESQ